MWKRPRSSRNTCQNQQHINPSAHRPLYSVARESGTSVICVKRRKKLQKGIAHSWQPLTDNGSSLQGPRTSQAQKTTCRVARPQKQALTPLTRKQMLAAHALHQRAASIRVALWWCRDRVEWGSGPLPDERLICDYTGTLAWAPG
jgi:hypothetical protein